MKPDTEAKSRCRNCLPSLRSRTNKAIIDPRSAQPTKTRTETQSLSLNVGALMSIRRCYFSPLRASPKLDLYMQIVVRERCAVCTEEPGLARKFRTTLIYCATSHDPGADPILISASASAKLAEMMHKSSAWGDIRRRRKALWRVHFHFLFFLLSLRINFPFVRPPPKVAPCKCSFLFFHHPTMMCVRLANMARLSLFPSLESENEDKNFDVGRIRRSPHRRRSSIQASVFW